MRTIQIALATDSAYLRLALTAMDSAIRRASRPVTVHFLGDGLTSAARRALETVCRATAGTRLVYHDVSDILPASYASHLHSSRTVLARLHIPHLAEGRVLYIDSDTLTLCDVAPLFDMDLRGNPIGAVRDFGLLDDVLRKHINMYRLKVMTDLMDPQPVHDYFNSGVLLMDCNTIRSDPKLLGDMTDIERAKEHELPDQDFLNHVMKGRVTFLDPCWNSFSGRAKYVSRVAADVLPPDLAHRPKPPRIAHFVYDLKPWNPIERRQWRKTSFLFRQFPLIARHRLAARRTLGMVRPELAELDPN